MQKAVAEKQLRFLGQRIRALRIAQRLSQEELASRAEIHVTYLSGLECGKRNPSMGIFFSIAGALKVSPAELLQFSSQQKHVAENSQKLQAGKRG